MSNLTTPTSSLSKLTFIVPVYNRPDELQELLGSLAKQTDPRFEVVIVEDGSSQTSEKVVASFCDRFEITYLTKPNSGPGPSRNHGCKMSDGAFFVFVDSDCILPQHYVERVMSVLSGNPSIQAFGGPDAAAADFSNQQKAINHSMTSFLTTGGIRGGSERVTRFMPRSFNMGFSRLVFERTGGFPELRFAPAKAAGEDLDLSYSIVENGFEVRRIPSAFVWHKRRTSWLLFWKQVFSFGYARVTVSKRHPGSLKPIHAAPSVYVLCLVLAIALAIFVSFWWLLPFAIHAVAIGTESMFVNRSVRIGMQSALAGIIQITGYGLGFLRASIAPFTFSEQAP